MKKTLKIFAFAVIALAALASCAKDQFKENVIPAGEKIQVSINGQIGEFTSADATKATAESVVRVTWESGEKVFVYDGSTDCIGTLDVTRDEKNASYALLSGTITASAASPSKLTLVYAKGATQAPAIVGGKISIDLSKQDQKDVPFVLYTTVAYDAAKLSKANEYISFSFATSVMTVNCTGLPTGAITKAEIDGVSTACELSVTGSGVTVAGASKGTITRSETDAPSVFTQSDSRGSFILALAADSDAPTARNILVYQDSKVYGAPFTSTTLAGNKSYNTVYQLGEYVAPPAGILPGVFSVADGKTVHFSKGNLYCKRTSSISNDWTWHFYDKQYGYNSLNSQCDEEGYRKATEGDTEKDLFYWGYGDWSTNPISETYLTNHTSDGEPFDPSEDWGSAIDDKGTWRTLTTAEWQYLFSFDGTSEGGTNYDNDNRRGKYKSGVTVCDKENCVVIAPDGWDLRANPLRDSYNSSDWAAAEAAGLVCLPAAGHRTYGHNVNDVGAFSGYWSSSANEADAAYCVFVEDGSVDIDGADSYHGYSVRLVTDASDGYAPAVKVTGVSLASKDTVEVGATKTLVATVTPANATHKEVTWSSSDETVATVDATTGEVTGVAAGSAIITATTSDGNFTAACIVTVTPVVPYVEIAAKYDGSNVTNLKWYKQNLAITASGNKAWKGGNASAVKVPGTNDDVIVGDYFQWAASYAGYNLAAENQKPENLLIYTAFTNKGCGDTKDEFTFIGSKTFSNANAPYYSSSAYTKYNDMDMETRPILERTPNNDDVANIILGGTWRMPTSDEFVAMNAATYWKWDDTDQGVYVFTPNPETDAGKFNNGTGTSYNKADALLFFPAAGDGSNSDLGNAGYSGLYLSSSLDTDDTDWADYLDFYSSYVDPQGYSYRYIGYSVRPVSDK